MMHLEGPWLNTTGKKKGKVKWASSEAKRKAEQLDKEWIALKKKHGVELEEKKRKQAMSADTNTASVSYRGSTDTKIPSLNTGWVPCVKKNAPIYTGTKMLGIGQLHKSNAVPVFSNEEAIEIARMRRG